MIGGETSAKLGRRHESPDSRDVGREINKS
jgi:hypothetical protein